MTMNDIKSVMIDKSPHTTRMVTKLLDKGLVDRKRSDKDRRIIFVGITKEGLDQLAEIDKKAEDTPRFIDNYSEEEARLVNSILDKMRG